MLPRVEIALIPLVSLALIGAGSAPPSLHGGRATYEVRLAGHEEVNNLAGTAGDMDGSGRVQLTVDLDRKQVCYDFNVSGLSTPLMAHIHRGSAMNNGPSVVTLFTGPGADLDRCLAWTPKKLAEIVADPSNFYVNLATTEYPDGAVRGQLSGNSLALVTR